VTWTPSAHEGLLPGRPQIENPSASDAACAQTPHTPPWVLALLVLRKWSPVLLEEKAAGPARRTHSCNWSPSAMVCGPEPHTEGGAGSEGRAWASAAWESQPQMDRGGGPRPWG
jgi:hypothetical protein